MEKVYMKRFIAIVLGMFTKHICNLLHTTLQIILKNKKSKSLMQLEIVINLDSS